MSNVRRLKLSCTDLVTSLSKSLTIVFGICLAALGVAILLTGGVELPTRTPPMQFHFSGFPLVFLGASPLLLGITTLAIASGRLGRDSVVTQLVIGAGIAMLGLAFALASKF